MQQNAIFWRGIELCKTKQLLLDSMKLKKELWKRIEIL